MTLFDPVHDLNDELGAGVGNPGINRISLRYVPPNAAEPFVISHVPGIYFVAVHRALWRHPLHTGTRNHPKLT
jgi:hypothetical protein